MRERVTADVSASAPPISQPSSAPRLSIVVLPFANLGNDPEQQYFADGITEDLTTDLSRIADMLWAERFNGDTSDLFALQDEVTSWIAFSLSLELIRVEAARPAEHPDALDCILRGRAAYAKPHSRESHAEAITLYERALALDPCSVDAKSHLATALADRVNTGTTVSAAADLARAEALIGQALTASPRDPLAHFAKGVVLRVRGRPEEAIAEFETVLASNRNETRALFHLGWCKLMTGSIDEVIPLAELVIRLSPRDPYIANRYSRLGLVHLLQSHTDDAVLWLERARSANPALPSVHANLASAFALKCSSECAAAELAEARRLSIDGRYSSVARLKAAGYFGVPKIRALFEDTFFAGLRLAGMPEE